MVNSLSKEEREKNPKEWKKVKDAGKRWGAEGVFSTFKRMFGESVKAVKWENVIKEISGMVNVYNWLLYLSEEVIKPT